MNKKYLILEPVCEGSGVAKIGSCGITSLITFELEDYKPLAENEVFKNYLVTKNDIRPLGMMSGKHESFSIAGISEIDGVVLMRKNLDTSLETAEFWGGDERAKSFAVGVSAETPEPPEINENQVNDNQNYDDLPPNQAIPEYFTFENFFGGGFEWQKISGYYLVYDYKIIKYILSPKDVYDYINYNGYYYIGHLIRDNTDYFAIAIPEKHTFGTPFSQCPELCESTYLIKDNLATCYTICVGIDATGEFFAIL